MKRPPPMPSPVFGSYWRFAATRQAIFHRRLAGLEPPWTEDPILQQFKFTNAYRASDRTSQYLIRHVVYGGDQDFREVFFRTILFKLFNRIHTWEAIVAQSGSPNTLDFNEERLATLLTERRASGIPVYSAAYIMPPAPNVIQEQKHVGHLRMLRTMLQDHLPERIGEAASLANVYELLRSYSALGRFLAFQFAIDLNYCAHLTFEENDFVVAGPGASEGIAKCFLSRDGWSDEDIIYWTVEMQKDEFERRGIAFANLWGRALQPVDCQNLYCEVAKYARVAHPEFNRHGGRSHIKQRYMSGRSLPWPWYPPKWQIMPTITPRPADTPASGD